MASDKCYPVSLFFAAAEGNAAISKRVYLMSIYALKPKFQNLLRPLVKKLYARGATANQVTVFACALSVLLGVLLCIWHERRLLFWLLPVWFLLRMALNAADGMLAREFGQKSALGGYLNEVTDVAADAALYLPLAFIGFSALQAGLFIWLAALSEFCGVLGAVHGKVRRYDGPMGKSDRAAAVSLLAVLYAAGDGFPQAESAGVWLLWLCIALLLWTCVKRIRNGLS